MCGSLPLQTFHLHSIKQCLTIEQCLAYRMCAMPLGCRAGEKEYTLTPIQYRNIILSFCESKHSQKMCVRAVTFELRCQFIRYVDNLERNGLELRIRFPTRGVARTIYV